jgi:hypothetical protein
VDIDVGSDDFADDEYGDFDLKKNYYHDTK